MSIKNIVFDADGTILEVENPYLSIAHALQCEKEVKRMVYDYLNGNLTYPDLVAKETTLFTRQYKKLLGRHPQTGDLERFLPHPQIKKGVQQTIEQLHHKKIKTYVLSSGFLYLVETLAELKIRINNIHANRFLYDTKGAFVEIKIDVTGEKIEAFKQIVKSSRVSIQDTAYVGDNAFDIPIINHLIEHQGTVFFIQNTATEFSAHTLPDTERLVRIKSLSQILKHL